MIVLMKGPTLIWSSSAYSGAAPKRWSRAGSLLRPGSITRRDGNWGWKLSASGIDGSMRSVSGCFLYSKAGA